MAGPSHMLRSTQGRGMPRLYELQVRRRVSKDEIPHAPSLRGIRPAITAQLLAACGGAGSGGWSLRLEGRIEPAGMHPVGQRIGRFGIDVSLAHNAAESRLNVAGRAAESGIEVEMAKGGSQIVTPKEVHHAGAEPYAFRIAGGAGESFLSFGKLIDLFLGLLALSRRWLLRRLLLPVLGQYPSRGKKYHCRGAARGENTHTDRGHDRCCLVAVRAARLCFEPVIVSLRTGYCIAILTGLVSIAAASGRRFMQEGGRSR